MKIQLSVKVEDVLARHAKSKPNVSRYVESLIKQDYQMELKAPIVQAVKESLMADEGFFSEVVERVILKSRSY